MKKLCLLLLTFTHILSCGKDVQKDEKKASFMEGQTQESSSISPAEHLILNIEKCDSLYLETKLKQYNVDPNYISKTGDRLIVLAAKRGIPKFIELLVNEGADINLKSENGDSAITVAARVGDSEFVETLLTLNANINSRTKRQETPLLISIKNGNEKLANRLILAGADMRNIDGNKNNADDYSRVMQLKSTVSLIKDVSKVNSRGISFTHLNEISQTGRLQSLEYVLNNFKVEDVINGNEYINKILLIEDSINRNAVLDLVIKSGISVNPYKKDKRVALITATINNDATTVIKLLGAGANPNSQDSNQYPSMHYATNSFSYDIIRYLVINGADTYYNVYYGTKIYQRNTCKNLPNGKRRMTKEKRGKLEEIEKIMDC
jgi:ankyrin repeat protein